MNNQIINSALGAYAQNPWIILVLVAWVAVWKGLSLWQSARQGQKVWFVFLLVINTFGILEIIYLILNRKPRSTESTNSTPTTTTTI